MAKLNFPPLNDADSDPINGFIWTDPNGQVWKFDSTIPAWKPLQPGESAVTFIGSIDLTIAPSSQYVSIEPGNQFVVSVGSTSVNGTFYPGLAGENVSAGTTIFYDGVEWHILLVSIPYTYPGGVERTVDNRLTDYVSVKDFDAKGDGTTDDTLAIQAAVDAIKGTTKTLFFPDGSYLLTKQTAIDLGGGIGIHDLAVLIDDSINIDASSAKFLIDISDPAKTHGFFFNDVSTAKFKGGTFVGQNTSGTTRVIHAGAAVHALDCTGITISDVICENMRASVHLIRCHSCIIKDCLGYRIDQTIQSGTFFGCYSGTHNIIKGCRAFGGCRDGDIFCYGTGYANQILECSAFYSLYGDDTYAIIGPDNQGIGLDAAQDLGVVDGCTVYGQWYGIQSKSACGQNRLTNNLAVRNKVGIAVRSGVENQDVSGHTLISGNTIIPADGNGNTNNQFGYLVTGIELSRCPSVTIEGNYIGVKESKFVNDIPDELDFASIVAVIDAQEIKIRQPCDIVISNNNINHSTLFYGSNLSYSTGPLIFAKSLWAGAVHNVAEHVNFNITGNSFNPHGGAVSNVPEPRIIKIDGAAGVIYSNNTHTNIWSANLKEVPYISTINVARLTANGNTFGRHATAFSHEYPNETEIDIQETLGCNISNNIFGRGLTDSGGAKSVIKVSGDGPCLVTGNTYWRVKDDGYPWEGRLVEYNYTNSGALILTNNCINGHRTSSNYYSVNGVDGETGAGIKVDDIVVNLPIPPVP